MYTFKNSQMQKPISVPFTIINVDHGHTYIYKRQEELGRGGFATVYRVVEQSSGKEYAMKVVPKERISKPKAIEKMKSEIAIQASLNHPNILRSYAAFEDATNHYIVTELCPGHSVRDLVKKAGHLSELESSKIMKDVLEGLAYLHDNRVIHRDLKLENFLVGKDGRIKIADFGLSAKLDYDDERKFTVCGTPNYLSPEILTSASKGHSYEVDIWAIGVCAYAMLVGRPPFETARTKLTYEHIKTCSYHFPVEPRLSHIAKDFIQSTLQIKPELRPNAQELLVHQFITSIGVQPIPEPLPEKAPEVVYNPPVPEVKHSHHREENMDINQIISRNAPASTTPETTMPKYCVARFCDHSEKYGLGYLLIDGTVGACFNDLSRMVMDPFEEFVQYWPNYQTQTPELMKPFDTAQPKKLSILRKFAESLKKTKSMFELPSSKYNSAIPLRHVKYWIRNDEATLFRMEDRDIQVNFNDRTKIVIFWSTKKLMLVHSIKESGMLIGLTELANGVSHAEEKKRFSVAKQLLAEMSGR